MQRCIITVLLLVLISSCEYEDNLYKLDNVTFRVFDLVQIDKNGCAVIDEFECDRDNLFVGLGIQFNKKYYSDSTRSRGFGAPFLGIDGTKEDVSKFEIIAFSKLDSVEITKGFAGIDSLNYLSKEFVRKVGPNNGKHVTESGCIDAILFKNIEELVSKINENNELIKGERALFHEVIFWIPKERLNNLADKGYRQTLIQLNISGKEFKEVIELNCAGN